ncbi:MAG: dUTP diphosphatase [Pseudomonadota bacterium]
MLSVAVTVAPLAHFDEGFGLPAYETSGAAGADLRASLLPEDRAAGLTIAPGARALVPTGLAMAIAEGYEMQIRPRSGLAFRHGLTVANAPGTIDSDYRGEVKVLLINLGAEPVAIAHGDRVAQCVLAPVIRAAFALGGLDDTARGAGGFGSTGVST